MARLSAYREAQDSLAWARHEAEVRRALRRLAIAVARGRAPGEPKANLDGPWSNPESAAMALGRGEE